MASAWQIIEYEMHLTKMNPPRPDDISIWCNLIHTFQAVRVAELMTALDWRGSWKTSFAWSQFTLLEADTFECQLIFLILLPLLTQLLKALAVLNLVNKDNFNDSGSTNHQVPQSGISSEWPC
jgi:hypothetical protein